MDPLDHDWWQAPRRVSVIVDNESWILPYAEKMVALLLGQGDIAHLCRSYNNVEAGDVAFFFGCTEIAKPDVLALNRRNLVVHESALPKGRGFSPLTWQVLAGCNTVPICLIEAVDKADAGAVIYRDQLEFEGNELNDELKAAQGEKTIELCLRFMNAEIPPKGEEQTGDSSWYERRTPEDSRLDPDKTLAEQFNLLRTVDNQRYPAFFELDGHRYILKIEKDS